MKLKRPLRSIRMAMRYWWPKKLTLDRTINEKGEYVVNQVRVYAWLWWNYQIGKIEENNNSQRYCMQCGSKSNHLIKDESGAFDFCLDCYEKREIYIANFVHHCLTGE